MVNLGIEDPLDIEFTIGPDINVENIGPVLDYNDGVKAIFTANNTTSSDAEIYVGLNIVSITSTLQVESFKYKLLKDTSGGTNYTIEVASGNFSTFEEGINSIVAGDVVAAGTMVSYQFVVYLDGNMENNIDMRGDTLVSTLIVSSETITEFIEEVMTANAVSDADIDFSQTSEESNTNGIYLRSGTENDTYPIYYYRGAVDNNLIFADTCWKIVRTTETGGLKLIYNGTPTNGQCNNTGLDSGIGDKAFNTNVDSPAYVGYMYGTPYTVNCNSNIRGVTDAYVYGNSVTYSNGTYTLTDTISGTWSSVYNEGLNSNHYSCLSTETTCENVYYIYEADAYDVYYITLTDGKKVEDALTEMLDNNTTSSTIKGNNTTEGTLDYWYYTNIEQKGYSSYIEDTVWCNDRNIASLGGWDPNGGSTSSDTDYSLEFSPYDRVWNNASPSLTCNRAVDKFTVSESNGNGALDYSVGLLTADEIMLAGADNQYSSNGTYYLYSGDYYWAGSPSGFIYDSAIGFFMYHGSSLYDGYSVDNAYGVRPSVSLKPGFRLTGDGDGSATNPYVVE